MDTKSFGKRLKVARKNKNLTAENLSEKIELSSKSIWQIEGGQRGTSLSTFVRICNALEVSPEFLLQDSLTYCDANTQYTTLLDILIEMDNKEFDLLGNIAIEIINNRDFN